MLCIYDFEFETLIKMRIRNLELILKFYSNRTYLIKKGIYVDRLIFNYLFRFNLCILMQRLKCEFDLISISYIGWIKNFELKWFLALIESIMNYDCTFVLAQFLLKRSISFEIHGGILPLILHNINNDL